MVKVSDFKEINKSYVAEAMALREGLRQALQAGHSHIIVEGDSKTLINGIIGSSPIPWRIKFLIQDIRRLAKHYAKVQFIHVWREANFVADAIAKVGHSVHVSVWEHCLPLCAANAFHLDQLGCGCTRGFRCNIFFFIEKKKRKEKTLRSLD